VTYKKTTSILIAALALVSCSGATASSPATTAAPETTPPTTKPKPTTTVEESTTTSSSSTTSTTLPPDPVMPLTGLPITDLALAARPAVVIKVSNDPPARPQSGLDSADIVYEAWGAGPTRFAAIFHSKDALRVGPVRSARTQDVDLEASFNGAIFACSGGNPRTIAAVRASEMLIVTEGTGPGWTLDPKRSRPHRTFIDPASLRLNADPFRPGPAQQFQYRKADEAATLGDPSVGFNLHIQNVRPEWRFVPASNTYERSQDGKPHVLADGTRVAFTNVVVLWINYDRSEADARVPDGGTVGTGKAVVFTNGRAITATWTRPDRLKPFALTDATGAPILLTPGTSFFELANTGQGGFPGVDQLDVLPA
jgi:Protein of unknown function (DUF3048) N-terminal domain/Protein of unknown function (DUF3048) C-terminal domain